MFSLMTNCLKSIRKFFEENYYDIILYLLITVWSILFVYFLTKFLFAVNVLLQNKQYYLKIMENYQLFMKIFYYNPTEEILSTFIDVDVKSSHWKLLSLNLEDLLNMLPYRYKTVGVVQYLTNIWWGTDIFGKYAIKLFLISLISKEPISDDDVSWLFTLLLEEARGSGSPYKMSISKNDSKISSLFEEDLSVTKNDINRFCINEDSSLPENINIEQLNYLIAYFQTLNKKTISENIVPENIVSENIVPESLTYLDYLYNNTIYIIEIIKNIIF
jgi:hypothetical protein